MSTRPQPVPDGTTRYRDPLGELVGEHTLIEWTELFVRAGLSREMAAEKAAKRLGLHRAAEFVAAPAVDATTREEKHLAEGDKLVRALGGRVYRLSQPRATKQSLGLPDRLYVLPTRKRWYTWEAKANWGRLTEEQAQFAVDAMQLGMPHVVGEVSALQAQLVVDGLLAVDAYGTIEVLPAEG